MMRGRDALREMLDAGKSADVPKDAAPKRSTAAVKAMNLGLQRLSDEAAAAKSLRATLASAEHVLEISTQLVDVSFIADRIPAESDAEFEALKAAISVHGQQVPILVRPHPDVPHRYQAAYGHRRLRAAHELGVPVKAIVRKLSDAELVVAQGQENSERRDLSFIERALFASHLDQHGFDRDVIIAALGIDKPELSRLLSVTGAIDSGIIMAIGPAPKVGRPRWLALMEKVGNPQKLAIAKSAIQLVSFQQAETNSRFGIVLSACRDVVPKSHSAKRALKTQSGKRVAVVETTPTGLRITAQHAQFGMFLERRLPDLVREFEDVVDSTLSKKEEAGR